MDDDWAFLDRLSGEWELRGTMGDVELHQSVAAQWILGGTYMWMHFQSVTPADNPTADYEAVYHIGYNKEHRLYVMHLLDTTEIPLTCAMGRCRRDANALPFLFEYGGSKFFNTFEWHPQTEHWSFLQTYEAADESHVFASKKMRKAPA
jgi:hypothetical protein